MTETVPNHRTSGVGSGGNGTPQPAPRPPSCSVKSRSTCPCSTRGSPRSRAYQHRGLAAPLGPSSQRRRHPPRFLGVVNRRRRVPEAAQEAKIPAAPRGPPARCKKTRQRPEQVRRRGSEPSSFSQTRHSRGIRQGSSVTEGIRKLHEGEVGKRAVLPAVPLAPDPHPPGVLLKRGGEFFRGAPCARGRCCEVCMVARPPHPPGGVCRRSAQRPGRRLTRPPGGTYLRRSDCTQGPCATPSPRSP